MKNNLSIPLSIIAVALIVSGTLLALNWKDIQAAEKTIEANGESKVEVKADKMVLSVGYETRAKTAGEAQDLNKIISNDIINALKSQGLAEEDIETESYYVNPEYDWGEGKQTLKGYLASHTIKVSTTKLDKAGEYIDAAMNAGANRVDGINYELTQERQNELKTQTLKEAAENARGKAEAIASGSGSRIKKLISIQDTSYNYEPWIYRMDYAKMAGAETAMPEIPTEVSIGKVTIQASVKAVFKLA